MLSNVGLGCIVGMTPACSLACSSVILMVCCFLVVWVVGFGWLGGCVCGGVENVIGVFGVGGGWVFYTFVPPAEPEWHPLGEHLFWGGASRCACSSYFVSRRSNAQIDAFV